MRKIDSFLKESQRLVGIGAGESSHAIAEGSPTNAVSGLVSLSRMAMKDFTFSDGTFIPKGTLVVVPSRCLHLDNEHYENAHVFDPFRFSDMRDEEGEGTKHQFVSTNTEYLPFGHGKHAWYGLPLTSFESSHLCALVLVDSLPPTSLNPCWLMS